MNVPSSKLPDRDMQNAPAAMARAAQQARKLAEETGTELVVVRNGELVCEVPKPSKQKQKPTQP